MKALFFYNPYSGPDLALKAAVEAEGLHVECIDIMTGDNPFKPYIRATPALVVITDDSQGEFLNRTDVDDVAYIRSLLMQKQDEEEAVVHGQANHRLDAMVKAEKEKAADAAVLDMLERGAL